MSYKLQGKKIVMIPRTLDEIEAAERRFFERVWYERHQDLRHAVEHRGVKIAPDIWRRALEAAKGIEAKHDREFLEPVDDFNWGMINGKLSALRWMLGEKWDMLDS